MAKWGTSLFHEDSYTYINQNLDSLKVIPECNNDNNNCIDFMFNNGYILFYYFNSRILSNSFNF